MKHVPILALLALSFAVGCDKGKTEATASATNASSASATSAEKKKPPCDEDGMTKVDDGGFCLKLPAGWKPYNKTEAKGTPPLASQSWTTDKGDVFVVKYGGSKESDYVDAKNGMINMRDAASTNGGKGDSGDLPDGAGYWTKNVFKGDATVYDNYLFKLGKNRIATCEVQEFKGQDASKLVDVCKSIKAI